MKRKTAAQLKVDFARAFVQTGNKSAHPLPSAKQLRWIEETGGLEMVERVLRAHGAAGEKLLKQYRARAYPTRSAASQDKASYEPPPGQMVMYKGGLARLGKQADERFMSEDDAERLAAKAEALKMPTWAHDVLMMHVGTTMLERVYDDSLGSTGKARKGLDRITQRAALIVRLVEAGVPETVLGQLAIKLGDETGVYEALAAHVGTMKMWGKDTAERALTMQKAAASAPKEEYEMHPLWGRIKKSRR